MSVANPGAMTQWAPASRVSLHSTQATPFRGQRSLTFRHGPGGITPPGCRDCQGTSEVPYRTRACGGDPAMPVRRAAHSPRNRRLSLAFAGRENVIRLLSHGVVTRQREQLALRRFRVAIRNARGFRRRQTNDQSVGSLQYVPSRPARTSARSSRVRGCASSSRYLVISCPSSSSLCLAPDNKKARVPFRQAGLSLGRSVRVTYHLPQGKPCPSRSCRQCRSCRRRAT